MSNKLPAFQFYPGDWKRDSGVQSLDITARGVWFEMLLLMHDSPERGRLILNGKPMSAEQIAQAIGTTVEQFNQSSSKIQANGVADFKQNTWICRRMVRDENTRQIRTKAGSLGGSKRVANLKQKSTPSSSSSSSSSSATSTPLKAKEESKPAARQNHAPNPLEAPAGLQNHPKSGDLGQGGDMDTPKRPKRIVEARALWQEMIDHVCTKWKKEKGASLPITGKYLGLFRHLHRHYEPEGVMALWDMWWEHGRPWSAWAQQSGRSLEGFQTGIPKLLDDSRWKVLKEKYRREFGRDAAALASKLKDAGSLMKKIGVI